jgi:hypothetical protein
MSAGTLPAGFSGLSNEQIDAMPVHLLADLMSASDIELFATQHGISLHYCFQLKILSPDHCWYCRRFPLASRIQNLDWFPIYSVPDGKGGWVPLPTRRKLMLDPETRDEALRSFLSDASLPSQIITNAWKRSPDLTAERTLQLKNATNLAESTIHALFEKYSAAKAANLKNAAKRGNATKSTGTQTAVSSLGIASSLKRSRPTSSSENSGASESDEEVGGGLAKAQHVSPSPPDSDLTCVVCELPTATLTAPMLLCDGDGCNIGQHMACALPRITREPHRLWFCDACTFNPQKLLERRALVENYLEQEGFRDPDTLLESTARLAKLLSAFNLLDPKVTLSKRAMPSIGLYSKEHVITLLAAGISGS